MRGDELIDLELSDVEVREDCLAVTIKKSKTDQRGEGFWFKIPKGGSNPCPVELWAMYVEKLGGEGEGRVFRNWNEKAKKYIGYTGENNLRATGVRIATFLELENPKLYTGHTFRRTGATTAANRNASSVALKRHFRWKSDTVAQGYVANSEAAKDQAADLLKLATCATDTQPPSKRSTKSIPTRAGAVFNIFNSTVNITMSTPPESAATSHEES